MCFSNYQQISFQISSKTQKLCTIQTNKIRGANKYNKNCFALSNWSEI